MEKNVETTIGTLYAEKHLRIQQRQPKKKRFAMKELWQMKLKKYMLFIVVFVLNNPNCTSAHNFN